MDVGQLRESVKEMLSGDYETLEIDVVPAASQVSLGKRAVRVAVIAFSIDLRESTSMLDDHRSQTTGKIHKAFLHVVATVVRSSGGKIRNFTGDGLLAFWPLSSTEVDDVVVAALKINELIRNDAAALFAKYRDLDFGIGVSSGSILVFKVGLEGATRDSDLVFIGDCVNMAVKMAKKAQAPLPIWVTSDIHDALSVELRLGDPDALIFDEPYWENSTMKYVGGELEVYKFKDEGQLEIVW